MMNYVFYVYLYTFSVLVLVPCTCIILYYVNVPHISVIISPLHSLLY
jgi:hypothetical protein